MLLSEVLSCLLVAVLWGCTNPLIKKGSTGIESLHTSASSQSGFFRKRTYELIFLISNWRYTVPFLINQAGSVLYFWALSSSTLSLAVPLTNSLTLVITVLFGQLLGEASESRLLYLGVGLVFLGIAITNYS